MMKHYGTCYIIGTPIGNLEDITYRALRIMSEVNVIACEDTRNTIKLLNHYNIKKKLVSYHKHNESKKSDIMLKLLIEGNNIAIVSDAGMPGISDPGHSIIRKCIDNDIRVEVIPGASAFVNALVVSGLDTSKFYFIGFLPSNNQKRIEELKSLRYLEATIIIYESPHKLIRTLKDIKEQLGNRRVAIARELTKIHEEIFRDNISRAIDYFLQKEPRGEFVIVVEGCRDVETDNWENISLEEHFQFYLDKDISRKEAVKMISQDREVPKKVVYEQLMKK